MSALDVEIRGGSAFVTTTEARDHQKTILDDVVDDFGIVYIQRNGKTVGAFTAVDNIEDDAVETRTYGDDS